jgi:hypothetical protein
MDREADHSALSQPTLTINGALPSLPIWRHGLQRFMGARITYTDTWELPGSLVNLTDKKYDRNWLLCLYVYGVLVSFWNNVSFAEEQKMAIFIYFPSYNGKTNCENASVMTARRNWTIMHKQKNMYISCMISGKQDGSGLRHVRARRETLTVFKLISTSNCQICSATPSKSVHWAFSSMFSLDYDFRVTNVTHWTE